MTYSAIQGLINSASANPFAGGYNLLPGEKSPKDIACVCDFSQAGIPASGYYIDPSRYFNNGFILAIQCLYIDNSANNGYVTVSNPTFGQNFSLPAGYQGYFPCIAAKGAGGIFYVTSTGNQTATIHLLNVMMPGYTWAATVTPPATGTPTPVSDAILDATVSAGRINVRNQQAQQTGTDKSGTIAVGATAQLLMAANAARQKWRLQNTDVVNLEGLYFGYGAGITPGGAGTFELASSSAAGFPGGYVEGTESNAIYVVATTAGHVFSAVEIV